MAWRPYGYEHVRATCPSREILDHIDRTCAVYGPYALIDVLPVAVAS